MIEGLADAMLELLKQHMLPTRILQLAARRADVIPYGQRNHGI